MVNALIYLGHCLKCEVTSKASWWFGCACVSLEAGYYTNDTICSDKL